MLITGASRGIGAATAAMAAGQGYGVCISYLHNEQAAQSVVRNIEASGGRAWAFQCDVASEQDIVSLFRRVDDTCGRLDVLVNNAGILELQNRVENMDVQRLQRIFSTNVIGSFLCAREAIKRMSIRHGGRGGSIVNVSSGASRSGSPNEYVDYAASKGAIDTFTIGLAKELASDGIRVNAVRPGMILTEIHASGGEPERVARLQGNVPLRRGGTAEEMANAILWLASEQSSYCTGALLDATGGL